MTYEEAHGYIEDLQRILTQYRFIFSREIAEANGKAIEALEKQIPKKPNIKHYEFYDLYSCPKCGKPLLCKNERGFFAGKRTEFCDKCGQKLEF